MALKNLRLMLTRWLGKISVRAEYTSEVPIVKALSDESFSRAPLLEVSPVSSRNFDIKSSDEQDTRTSLWTDCFFLIPKFPQPAEEIHKYL